MVKLVKGLYGLILTDVGCDPVRRGGEACFPGKFYNHCAALHGGDAAKIQHHWAPGSARQLPRVKESYSSLCPLTWQIHPEPKPMGCRTAGVMAICCKRQGLSPENQNIPRPHPPLIVLKTCPRADQDVQQVHAGHGGSFGRRHRGPGARGHVQLVLRAVLGGGGLAGRGDVPSPPRDGGPQ